MVQPSLGVDGDGEWLGGKSPQWSERRARLEELIVTLRIADELAAGKYLITSGELAELMNVHASAVTSRGEEWTWRNWQISRVRRESNQILWQLERIDVSKEPSSEAPPRVICERGCEQVMDLDFPLECFDYDLSATALVHFLNASQLAVDTETMGLNIPRDRLCLVQLCDPQGQVAVVKIGRGQREAPHLQQLLEHPRITKIFHYARFDLATLRYHLGIRVHPVFCTKIASKIARTYSPRHGLKDLVLDLLGVEIDKSAQSSDWGNTMALREDQIRYAANDVRYLIPLWQQLTEMLKREERFELVQAALSCLPAIVDLDLAGYTQVFEHG